MSITVTPHSPPNDLVLALQESSSWTGRCVTRVHTSASYVISSIGSVVQSILSNRIYAGTCGLYTLDDLKDSSSKENASLEGSQKIIEKEPLEYECRLKRQASKTSVTPSLYDRIEEGASNGSPYANLYADMKDTIKLPSDKSDTSIGSLESPTTEDDSDDGLIQ